ncbi:uncharacterized protein [Epargyreus clarus]|uniref:uncharacterized protein n=1 Tax=Epargyreus clarus TaxID=520877 RepID=UPI003C30B574
MRDYQEVIIKFVNIVKRHPEVYNSGLETYRTRHAEIAWDEIADSVRTELDEECTVEEIKTKWKGIRSSYNRFKKKMRKEGPCCKKYYLYDSLQFLEPFIKPKRYTNSAKEQIPEDCSNYTNSDEDDKTQDDYDTGKDTWQINVKSEATDVSDEIISNEPLSMSMKDASHSRIENQVPDPSDTSNKHTAKKRKVEESVHSDNTDSEDLQFFKSIMPDIKDFTAKDKRRLKMGILQLIDDIESSRKQVRPFHLCNCH